MSTVVLGPAPPQIEELIEGRRRSGLHRLDEVWEGVLHMVPAPGFKHASIAQRLAVTLDGPARAAGLIPAMHEFNLGADERDFRVPDGGLLREDTDETWLPTAALVVEIVSPNDETWQKLPFYAAHRVEEVLIVEPAQRAIHWLALADRRSGRAPAGGGGDGGGEAAGAREGGEAGGGGDGRGEAGGAREEGEAGEYVPIERSALIDLGPAELAGKLGWL